MSEDNSTDKGLFTQEQVNGMIAAEKRTLAAKFDEEKSGLQKQIDETLKASEAHKGAYAQSEERIKQMQAELDASTMGLTRMRVGVEAGLPVGVIDRLQGDDEAAIKADAEKLAEFVKSGKVEPKLPAPKGEPPAETTMNDLIRQKAGRGTVQQ